MKRVVIFLALIALAMPAFAELKTEVVDGYTLSWEFQGDNLYIELSYEATGWIAVGFDAENKMKGANIIMADVQGDTVVIEDHFGTSPIAHKEDTSKGGTDDVTLISGSEENGVTTVIFTIPLDSGDSCDKILEEGSTYRIIFASSNQDNFRRKHRDRTGADITL